MATNETGFGLNDPLAVHRWSKSLAVEQEVRSYFKKFEGDGDNVPIKVQRELEKEAGEKVTVALRLKLAGDGIEGDNIIEGTDAEEPLDFFDDALFIDQRRKGTNTKGKMSQQRVPYNLRLQGRDALAVWNAEDMDQQKFMYLSGARGINSDFHFGLDWTGRANNPLTAPDAEHIMYAGAATGAADMVDTDLFDLTAIEKLVAKLETLDPLINPIRVNGEDKFVVVMHTFVAYSMRTSTSTNDWLNVHLHADEKGPGNLLYKNALGEYAGMILHKHRNAIRFDTYGAAGTLTAARSLVLGAHCGMIAWGGAVKGQNRFSWHEETMDRGNKLSITAGAIYGIKKSRFNGEDFGLLVVDSYCPTF